MCADRLEHGLSLHSFVLDQQRMDECDKSPFSALVVTNPLDDFDLLSYLSLYLRSLLSIQGGLSNNANNNDLLLKNNINNCISYNITCYKKPRDIISCDSLEISCGKLIIISHPIAHVISGVELETKLIKSGLLKNFRDLSHQN